MSAVLAPSPYISEVEYLESEVRSPFKREYLGGAVYAMAGASEPHNIIATNLVGMLHARLRGKKCQPFGSDMKLLLRPAGAAYYYYPDAMIACDPTDVGHGWRERPVALFEILSVDTRQIDEREKRLAYLQLDSLQAYVRIEQDRPEVVVEIRTPGGWRAERISGAEAVVSLRSLEIELPLAELYERVSFGA
jgi:Uma2 family endonuclease